VLQVKYQPEAIKIRDAFRKSKRALIITHKNPDGDTMGSALAIYDLLHSLNKEATVFCVDPFPESFYFLSRFESVVHEFDINDFDIALTLDCGADYMTGITNTHPELFNGRFPLINIDHHKSNDDFGTWNIVDTSAASTTLIIAEALEFLDYKISHRMATCLMCGLFTDTGSFQHSNTTPRELRMAAHLMRKGASIHQIRNNIFKNNKISTMKLWGRVLSRAYKDSGGITISNVSDDDFRETGSNATELSGVVDFLNSVPDSKFSLLLTENNGKVKGSFRTMRDDVDVANIAGQFGGGGHKKAAGFTLPGKLEKEVRWKVVQEN
jgi:phosphoesterase RecJ-like protein